MGFGSSPSFCESMSLSSSVANGKPVKWHGRILPNGKAGFSPEKVSKRSPVNAFDLNGLTKREIAEQDDLVQMYGVHEVANIKKGGSPLGLSNVPKSHRDKKRKPRGSSGLTSHGRAVVYNAINYLEWRFKPKHLTFATLTLPDVTPEQDRAVAKEWANIVKVFIQNIGRKLHEQNLPRWVVGAFEYQPKRAARENGSYLHLHCVFVGRGYKGHWAVTPEQVRFAWRSAVLSRVPDVADCNFAATEHVVRVRKSAAGYLSKYLTKGSGIVGDVADVPAIRGLASWFACSLSLRRIVSRSVRSGREVGSILRGLPQESWLYLKAIRLDSRGEDGVIVGWYGQLKPGWSQFFDVPVHVPIEESDRSVFSFPLPKVFHDGYFPIVLGVPIPVRNTVAQVTV